MFRWALVTSIVTGLALAVILADRAKQARPDNPIIALEYTVDNGQERRVDGPDAWRLMGRFHIIRNGAVLPPVSRKKFVKDLQSGVVAGDPTAMYIGSRAYLDRVAVPRDVALSRELLQRSARAGHLSAQFRLGRSYLSGENGFPADATEGERWLLSASKLGHVGAAHSLASALRYGEHGLGKDCKRALDIAEAALPAYREQRVFNPKKPAAYYDIAFVMGQIHMTDCQHLRAEPAVAAEWLAESVERSKKPEVAELLAGLYALEPRYMDAALAEHWASVARQMRKRQAGQ